MNVHVRARVRNGRLLIDEPVELPDGTELDLVGEVTAVDRSKPAEVDAEVRLSVQENAALWSEWAAKGPQGPLTEDGDEAWP